MPGKLKQVQQLLKDNATEEGRAAHHRFVPGDQRVYGVRMPVLNKLASAFRAEGFEFVEELWLAGAFEEKILAIKIIERIAKQDPDRALMLVRSFSKNIGNWAVCDALGMQALKSIVESHEAAIFTLAQKLNRSSDFWQRRLSLVLVEWYTRKKSCHPAIHKLIDALKNDEEYYVKKAIVWINKNFSKEK